MQDKARRGAHQQAILFAAMPYTHESPVNTSLERAKEALLSRRKYITQERDQFERNLDAKTIDKASEYLNALAKRMSLESGEKLEPHTALDLIWCALAARRTRNAELQAYKCAAGALIGRYEKEIDECDEEEARIVEKIELGKRKSRERAQAKLAKEGIADPDAPATSELPEEAQRTKRRRTTPRVARAPATSSAREPLDAPVASLSPPSVHEHAPE